MAASLAVAPCEGNAAAARPGPALYFEAAAASNQANLGTSCKVGLSVSFPVLS